MIGFKADPRRVDYWTYGKALSLDEIKQRPIWNTFSEAIKTEFEAAAARGPAELERMRALRAQRSCGKGSSGQKRWMIGRPKILLLTFKCYLQG